MLAFRSTSLNVYYRGGNILRLGLRTGGGYQARFDTNYAKSHDAVLPELPNAISTPDDCVKWVAAFPALKEVMNGFFSSTPKPEREFQQLVAWENNRSGVANSSEYFITDIEYADVEQGARLDMLGLKWLASDRKTGSKCRPVFLEMKYGIDSYDGASGIRAHLEDISGILADASKVDVMRGIICDQFEQLNRLGLVRFSRSKSVSEIVAPGKPEVIFVLANHNPRSRKLLDIIQNLHEPEHFDLRFFVSTFAGYAMHEASMLDLPQFQSLLSRYAP